MPKEVKFIMFKKLSISALVTFLCLNLCACYTVEKQDPGILDTDTEGNTFGYSTEADVYMPKIIENKDKMYSADSYKWAAGVIETEGSCIGPNITEKMITDAGFTKDSRYTDIVNFTDSTSSVSYTKNSTTILVSYFSEKQNVPYSDCHIATITLASSLGGIVGGIETGDTRDSVISKLGQPTLETTYSTTFTSISYKNTDSTILLELQLDSNNKVVGQSLQYLR